MWKSGIQIKLDTWLCICYYATVCMNCLLTELCGSFLSVDDGRFGGQEGDRAPGGKGALAGVELLSEKLLQLHADLDEVWRGGA